MKCTQCGAELPAGAAFCGACGKSVPQKKSPKLWMILAPVAAILLLVGIILAVVLIGPAKKTVQIADYLSIKVEGYSGQGKLSYKFDEVSFVQRILGDEEAEEYGDVDEDDLSPSELEKLEEAMDDMDDFLDSIKVKVEYPEDRTKNTLRNGDELVFNFEWDEDLAKEFKVVVEKSTLEYKVKKLEELLVYDLLTNFELRYRGVNGYAYAELYCTKSETIELGNVTVYTYEGYNYIDIKGTKDGKTVYETVNVWISDTSNVLMNGDVITMVADGEIGQFVEYGVALPNTKDITVSGLQDPVNYDLLQNFELQFDGINGYGSAQIVCTKTETVQVGELTISTREGSDYITISHDDWYYDDTIYLDYPYSSNLSNGETVTVSMYLSDAEYYLTYGLKVERLSKDITVSGLQEPQEYDIFQYVEFTQSGINGAGEVGYAFTESSVMLGNLTINFDNNRVYDQNGWWVCTLYFSLSQSTYLSEGDIVTLSVSADEDALAEHGFKLQRSSIDFTVDNLGHFVTDLDSIKDSESVQTWIGQVITSYQDNMIDNWSKYVYGTNWAWYSDPVMHDDMQLYKLLLGTPKDAASIDGPTLYIVIRVTLDDSNMDPTPYYFAVSIEGVQHYDSDKLYLYESVWSNGYPSFDALCTAVVDTENEDIQPDLSKDDPAV